MKRGEGRGREGRARYHTAVFCNLILGVTHHAFCPILLVTQTTSSETLCPRLHQGVSPGGRILGGHLEAAFLFCRQPGCRQCSSLCMEGRIIEMPAPGKSSAGWELHFPKGSPAV